MWWPRSGKGKAPAGWSVSRSRPTIAATALAKLEQKCCDLMVANSPAAIGATDNQVEVLDAAGKVVATLAGSKENVATGILKIVQERLIQRRS